MPSLTALTSLTLSSMSRNWIRSTATFLLLFLLVLPSAVKSDSSYLVSHNKTSIQDFYFHRLLEIYGENHTLSAIQLNEWLTKIRGSKVSDEHSTVSDHTRGTDMHQSKRNCTGQSGSRNLSSCNLEQCLSGKEIFQIHGMGTEKLASSKELHEMSATILYQVQNENCSTQTDEGLGKEKPKPEEVWGYGFLAVTFINLCAVLGIVFLPLMRQRFYKKMLLFMVALAVGTLVGSALLVLIPDALDIPHLLGDIYIWKVTVVMGGIYLFFLIERVLHLYNQTRKMAGVMALNLHNLIQHVQSQHTQEEENEAGYDSSKASNTNDSHESESLRERQGSVKVNTRARHDSFNMTFDVPEKVIHNGHVQDGPVINPAPQKIKPVAWMVIFGDGVHNFIDGLSIGAAFAESILAGFSISLAVICEELPHELGDFAILLNAGMSMKKALLFNFLSACMCYLGLIIGILVGEMTAGSTWIFALAGGMFLYISLVDMLPEVNHAAEVEGRGCLSKKVKVLLLQNVGLISGYSIILILTKFATQIDLSGS